MTGAVSPKDVLDFWFAAGRGKWYAKDDGFDADIRARFAGANQAARAGDLDHWADSPQGALALIVLLDQFTRNLNRDSPDAYAADGKARDIAVSAIDRGFDMELPAHAREWFYLPLMHSEDLGDQNRCVELAPRTDGSDTLKHATGHRDVIRRFGRFPHRNRLLGRESTPKEIAFLEDGGFSG